MASPSFTFKVKRCGPELVVPAKPTPHELKYLSDIDNQGGMRSNLTRTILFYKNNPSMQWKDPVKVIREALGRALTYYYPFAGRLKEGRDGKLVVDCNGEGVMFIEADAVVTLDRLGLPIQPPFPFIDEVLYNVPGSDGILGCPLLLIQVSFAFCFFLVSCLCTCWASFLNFSAYINIYMRYHIYTKLNIQMLDLII